jgi:FkbH-like protein
MKKVALLSNVNIDPLKNHLQKNDSYELYLGGYNQWQPELLNPSSGLYDFQPDFVFIYLNAEELKTDITELFSCIDVFGDNKSGIQFIISDLSFPPFRVTTYLNQNKNSDFEINNQLKQYAASKDNVFLFDFNRLISYHGYNLLFDDKYWYLGKIKFSNFGFKVLANELIIVLDCLLGKIKKVLILDLDNTLWGGIASEDGWQNLQISEEGVGKIYADFQRNIKLLSRNGIILALCSKNNENDAREVFEKNTNMQLQWDEFTIRLINWNQKSENILRIASTLELGTDSMVFIDDNPVERELAKQSIPELTVPEFPKDISSLNRWFIIEVIYPYFSKKSITVEDADKSNQYKRKIERDKTKLKLNYDDFILQLHIKLTVNYADSNSCQRIAQLTQKTNQFNLSVKRYTDVEIIERTKNPAYLVYTCEYEDKFGNEGIIGCAIVHINNQTSTLDSFILSCRVLGRKVESSFLDIIINELNIIGIKTLEAYYSETSRNKMVKDFLNDFGFESKDEVLYIKNIKK